MKWLLLVIPLLAMTQINNGYKDEQAIFNEFKNVYNDAQDQSFTEVNSTPSFQDMKDGQIFIYSSSFPVPAPNVNLMLRLGSTVYVSPFFKIMQGR